jgi:uncharacterized protein
MRAGSMDGLTAEEIAAILGDTRRIAVVGASANPERPSHHVLQTLVRHGYEVVPVNPGLAGQLLEGRPVVATLADAGPLDMVDIFRRPSDAAAVAEEAIRLGARTIWTQLDIPLPAAVADAARQAGIRVVMDRCPAIEIPRLGVPRRTAP